MVEFIVDAVNQGVDAVFAAALPVLTSYGLYLAFRARKELMQGLPDFLQVLFANFTEAYIEKQVVAAVNYAEEYGKRYAKEGGQIAAVAAEEKLTVALEFLFDLPLVRRLVSEERAVQLIEAILPQVGLGAAGAVSAGADLVVEKIEEVPPPPAE